MLSIIVPIFNTEKYLRECLDSILNQAYRDFELLLIDDGSTDDSWKICNEYKEKDERIRVFHKENSGVSATRNFGIDMAKGEYISFCDSDDLIKPELYSLLMEKMLKNNADRVCGGYEYLYPDGHVLYCKPRRIDGMYSMKDILPEMIDDGTMSGFLFSGVNNSVFKREIIEKKHIRFAEDIRYNEDSLFSFEYALASQSIYSIQSQPLYLYRQHGGSSTAKRVKGDKYSSLREKLSDIVIEKEKINYTLQMRRRMVTESFWEVLDISSKENGLIAIKNIKQELKKNELVYNLKIIKPSELNKYKRIYFFLMKYKMAVLIYFISKRIVPILSKHLSR